MPFSLTNQWQRLIEDMAADGVRRSAAASSDRRATAGPERSSSMPPRIPRWLYILAFGLVGLFGAGALSAMACLQGVDPVAERWDRLVEAGESIADQIDAWTGGSAAHGDLSAARDELHRAFSEFDRRLFALEAVDTNEGTIDEVRQVWRELTNRVGERSADGEEISVTSPSRFLATRLLTACNHGRRACATTGERLAWQARWLAVTAGASCTALLILVCVDCRRRARAAPVQRRWTSLCELRGSLVDLLDSLEALKGHVNERPPQVIAIDRRSSAGIGGTTTEARRWLRW